MIIALQQRVLMVANPKDRQKGWIKKGDEVVFVRNDENGIPKLTAGHICSWPGSHGSGLEIDNIKKTIVWSDEVLNPMSDNADDAYEIDFDVHSPRLMRMDELDIFLHDSEQVMNWFKGEFDEDISRQLIHAIRSFLLYLLTETARVNDPLSGTAGYLSKMDD